MCALNIVKGMDTIMNINLELYKLFYIVAKCQNITKASKELYISQPALSKSIKNLETQLNCDLFKRSKKGVTLTQAGEILYKCVNDVMASLENTNNVIKSLSKLNSEILNIGIDKTLMNNFLLPYLNSFLEENTNTKLNIIGGSFKDKINNVRNSYLDFIILYLPASIPKDFEQIKLKGIETILVGNKNYEYLKNKTINIKDINNYPIIMNAKGSTTRNYIDQICNKENITLKPKMELASTTLVTNFINSGHGLGFLTKEYIKEQLDNQELFEIKTNPKIDTRYIGIIYQNNKPLNNIASKFITFLQEAQIQTK